MNDRSLNQPLGGNEMPHFGGIATMMRLPHVSNAADLLFEMLCVMPGVDYRT